MKTVLIADYKNSDAVAQIPYLLKQAPSSVEVFCDHNSWLLKNSHHDVWHQVDRNDVAGYAAKLKSLVCNKKYDLVVLADDYVLRIMNAALTDEGIATQVLPLTDLSVRSFLGSKVGLSVWCAQHGICTPRYEVYKGERDVGTVVQGLTFPLVLKIDQSDGGRGVFFCSGSTAVHETLARLSAEEKKNLVFQEYITGDNIAVETLYKKGMLVGYAAARIIETMDHEFGLSVVRQYEDHPNLESILRKFGTLLGINGFCSMTYMRSDVSRAYYLIEADIRPNAWFSLTATAGFDFSLVIKSYFSETPAFIRPSYADEASLRKVRHPLRDLSRAIQDRNLSLIGEWIINHDQRWRFIPWYDRKLLLGMVKQLIKAHLYQVGSLRTPLRILKHWKRRITQFSLIR